MNYIVLILKICSVADPNLCTTERETLAQGSMNACLFQAPKKIAMANYVNPNWEIKEWHCVEENGL